MTAFQETLIYQTVFAISAEFREGRIVFLLGLVSSTDGVEPCAPSLVIEALR